MSARMSGLRRVALLALPLLLLPGMARVFVLCAAWLGQAAGYLLGFLIYWLLWCLLLPWALLGRRDFAKALLTSKPLLSAANWPAAVLLLVITLVTLAMYGADFARAPQALLIVAVPAATINGICEELLWRGLYVRVFPRNPWLGIVYPALGFAAWHIAPLQVYPDPGGLIPFLVSTCFLGLAYGYIAYRTGSAKWTALSHSLNGILALSGMLAPSVLMLLGI